MAHQAQCKISYYELKRPPDDYFFNVLRSAKNGVIAADIEAAKSELHIEFAYNQSQKIFESRKRYKDPASVFLMLLTGESQIGRAMELGSIKETTRGIFAIQIEDGACARMEESLSPYLKESKGQLPKEDTMDNEMFWRMAKVSISI